MATLSGTRQNGKKFIAFTTARTSGSLALGAADNDTMAQLNLVPLDGFELEGWHIDEDVAIFDAGHHRLQPVEIQFELIQTVVGCYVQHRIHGLLDAPGRADAVTDLEALNTGFQF